MARRAIEPYPANTRRIIQLSSRDGAPQETPVVCEQIRYYRKLRRLEQKQLARQLGINGTPAWVIGEQLVHGAVRISDSEPAVYYANR